MNKVLTAICCISLAALGYFITHGDSTLNVMTQNTLAAATIPYTNFNGPMPLDLKLDLAKEIENDNVVHDTVKVINTKYVRVPVTKRTTDTIYVANIPEVDVASVKNKGPGDRKEGTPDETVSPKPTVILTIDGKMVYSSENVIQSDGEEVSMSASDGPQKP